MERDPNPIPKIELFSPLDTIKKIGHFLFDHIQAPGLSSHNRGGGPALDRELYDDFDRSLEDTIEFDTIQDDVV